MQLKKAKEGTLDMENVSNELKSDKEISTTGVNGDSGALLYAKYAVVWTEHFSPGNDCGKIYICNSKDEAEKVLMEVWTNYKQELGECSELMEESCYCEKDFGRIGWNDGSFEEFRIISNIIECSTKQ